MGKQARIRAVRSVQRPTATREIPTGVAGFRITVEEPALLPARVTRAPRSPRG
jgi:hypothetical protein